MSQTIAEVPREKVPRTAREKRKSSFIASSIVVGLVHETGLCLEQSEELAARINRKVYSVELVDRMRVDRGGEGVV